MSWDATQHTIGRSHINTIHARSALPEKGHRVPCRVRSKGILPSVLGERNRGACRFVLLPILYPQAPLGQRRSLIRRGGRGGLGTGTRFPCLLLLPTQLGFECSTQRMSPAAFDSWPLQGVAELSHQQLAYGSAQPVDARGELSEPLTLHQAKPCSLHEWCMGFPPCRHHTDLDCMWGQGKGHKPVL